MTGPVERVPLTDERLVQWASNPAYYTTRETVRTLIAELRASRARERALRIHVAGLEASLAERVLERDRRQQRIDQALLRLHRINPYPQSNPLPSIAELRTILAGTEPDTAPLD